MWRFCRGVFPPESGLASVLLPPPRTQDCLKRQEDGKTVLRFVKKDPFLPLFERTSPSITPSSVFSVALVIQTQLRSTGPRGRLKPHGLATSDRDTRLSLR